MKRSILGLISILLTLVTCMEANAKMDAYDLMEFNAPRGTREQHNEYLGFSDVRGQSFVQYALYRSVEGSGDPAHDFLAEWTQLVARQYQAPALPTTKTISHDGWVATIGAAPVSLNGTGNFVATLAVFTSNKTKISILVNHNDDKMLPAIDAFMASLKLHQPASPPQQNSMSVTAKPSSATRQEEPASAQTVFDDGWTATMHKAYVKVAKGDITVFLHYPIAITDQTRNHLSAAMWDRLVVPRYSLSNVRYFEDTPCYNCIYYYQATGIEKTAGKRVSIGFRIMVDNGIAYCIEIIAPSDAALQQEFPSHDKVAAMLNYNKFQVTKADLMGTWSETSHSAVNMYNTITGAYAGMNMTASNASFEFAKDGKYQSRHVGAYGMVGNSQVYDQNYRGQYTLSNWEMSLSNRYAGKTETFYAHFVAVPGGKVLFLVNKQATGMKYRLAKMQ